MDAELLTIPPKSAHTHTVVFLHGRGDNARNFAWALNHSADGSKRTLFDHFPSFRWVFPQAPRPFSGVDPRAPTTQWQWFDIHDVRDFSANEGLQAAGLAESVPIIIRVLQAEARLLHGRWDRIVLAGISQGAAASVHALLNLSLPTPADSSPPRLGAFLGFSCRMPFPGRTLAETREILDLHHVPDTDQVLRNTPVLLEHCVDDPLVLIGNGRALRNTLQGFGAKVEMKEYSEGGHWFHSPDGIADAVSFLHEKLALVDTSKPGACAQGPGMEMDLS